MVGAGLWCLAACEGFDAVAAAAMEARWQDMDQETADEFARWQAHNPHAIPALDAMVFPAEGNRGGIGADQVVV
jgi:hypothetical protein